ncbi:MAG TPA: hypothetical protein VHX38_11825 [Pseudonocardiaceae bacterium]|nr:hypothetical protein [Pseudonocardiaceae bacterium]
MSQLDTQTDEDRPARGSGKPAGGTTTVMRRLWPTGGAADLTVAALGTLFVVLVALQGWRLLHSGDDLFLFFPPLLAWWQPHVGIGTGPAIALALLTVGYGPQLAARLRWRPLLLTAYATSVGWILFLALAEGFNTGVASKLTSPDEYLHDVPEVSNIAAMLREFTSRIVDGRADQWTTHVAAHPPGAFLVFLWLNRIGLAGGGAAGIFCILVGGSACVAVAVTLRALGAEHLARAALPFGVLIPAAVWIGVSADGMFAGVLAWGIALLAIGATGRGVRADLAALAGGLLLGYTLYLSYGLALAGLLPLVVIGLTRRLRPTLLAVLGVAVVVAAFTASGFWWLRGYQLTAILYTQSIAKHRPYAYFLFADLAAFAFTIGPAALAGLRRLAVAVRRPPIALTLLVGAALAAILLADLSGFSKAEVERIWLPFAVWLIVPCALLDKRSARWWLAGQAVLALLVDHLLITPW